MSLSIMFTGANDGDDGPFALPSSSNWLEVGKWLESKESYPYLESLVNEGECNNTRKLSKDLEKIESNEKDIPEEVKILLDHLKELVGVGHKSETATIYN